MVIHKTYNLVLGHRGEACVLGAGLPALGCDVLNLFSGAVGEVARVRVSCHFGASNQWESSSRR